MLSHPKKVAEVIEQASQIFCEVVMAAGFMKDSNGATAVSCQSAVGVLKAPKRRTNLQPSERAKIAARFPICSRTCKWVTPRITSIQ